MKQQRESQDMDFGSFGTIALEDGQKKPLYAFVFVLGYSRAMHVEFITDRTIAKVLMSHRKCFEALGGAPRRTLYDHFKADVFVRDDERQPFLYTAKNRLANSPPKRRVC